MKKICDETERLSLNENPPKINSEEKSVQPEEQKKEITPSKKRPYEDISNQDQSMAAGDKKEEESPSSSKFFTAEG